jgi:DNA-binding SARP family transcriptional activator/transcriptional regulator with XRE-family HTH domain
MGDVMREFRRAAGLTQRELAQRAGVSLGAIRDLEQGRTLGPRSGSLDRIVAVLGLDADSADEVTRVARTAAAWRSGSSAEDGHRPGRTSGMWIRVLGPIGLWRDGAALDLGGSKQRAVLGLLAAMPDSIVHRETIIDALWPGSPPATAANLVQGHLSGLRRLMGVDPARARGTVALVSMGASYRLQAGPGQLDLLAFWQAAKVGQSASAAGDYRAACDAYSRALGLWRGRPLSDVEVLRGHHAVLAIARQLDDVVIEYSRAASAIGCYGRVLPLLWDLHAREPLNEQALAQLVLALAGTGKQAQALKVYEVARLRLRDELGILPGTELRDAHQRVLRQDITATAGNQGS